MAGATLVFMSAWFSPSQDYVPILSEMLFSEEMANWHEQSVELLGALASADAVPALTHAIAYRWDFDEWLSIPRKALRSLKAIGTSDALRAIRQELQSEVGAIREEAAELLE
jgi:hypothetical protein